MKEKSDWLKGCSSKMTDFLEWKGFHSSEINWLDDGTYVLS